jgi:hypothetical protein
MSRNLQKPSTVSSFPSNHRAISQMGGPSFRVLCERVGCLCFCRCLFSPTHHTACHPERTLSVVKGSRRIPKPLNHLHRSNLSSQEAIAFSFAVYRLHSPVILPLSESKRYPFSITVLWLLPESHSYRAFIPSCFLRFRNHLFSRTESTGPSRLLSFRSQTVSERTSAP